ncbi:MAG: hypothetical protein IKO25_01360 [Clostridia bacterium]|nr:hypothetical protein [Clostridia bacterium]
MKKGNKSAGDRHQKLPFPHGASLSDDRKVAAAEPRREEADYYKLKVKAVEDLVTANPENSPPVSKKELRKYQRGPKVKLADWIKAILLKWWIAGVICYFFVWGLSTFRMNQWDLILILGVVLGLATNLLTNNIFRFIEKKKGAYNRWMMFPKKGYIYYLLDILYGMLLVVCTVMSYNGINLAATGGVKDAPAALGVEPILFGALITVWDLLFLGMKRLGGSILADAREKNQPISR